MQTHFTPQQLENPAIAEADGILRSCVHCGFCTATCPTYVTLGNELDSPRGRIYLIKDMLESGRDAGEREATHIDRCLSCLSCMTTCPSGVDYMHLVDHARVHIERTHKRPLMTRLTRELLAQVLPYKGRFRASLALSKLGRPFVPLLDRIAPLKPLAAMLKLAPASSAPKVRETANGETFTPKTAKHGRVALLTGCAQPALDSGINAATIELLTGQGIEVVLPKGETCCGSLVHHMGREKQALGFARHMVDVWHAETERGLDAIVITTSGCGTTIKDYGHMLRHDPAYAEKAAKVAGLAKDVTEYLVSLDLPSPTEMRDLTVAYHAACSLQHGQKIKTAPKDLLRAAGFDVREAPESHLCCGSAGTYNILQPDIAGKLRDRKVTAIESVTPDVIAAGNIGCLTQIGSGTGIPTVHTVKLLNWAYGGAKPSELEAAKAD